MMEKTWESFKAYLKTTDLRHKIQKIEDHFPCLDLPLYLEEADNFINGIRGNVFPINHINIQFTFPSDFYEDDKRSQRLLNLMKILETNESIHSIEISQSFPGDEVIKKFYKQLISNKHRSIQKLCVNTQIRPKGAKKLLAILTKNKYITSLNCFISNDCNTDYLMALQINQRIRSLSIRALRANIAWVDYFTANKNLTSIELSIEKHITQENEMDLFSVLESIFICLEKLVLSLNIKLSTISHVADIVSRNRGLKHLEINSIHVEKALDLGLALEKHPSLTYLKLGLSKNHINDPGILIGLKGNTNIKTLIFPQNWITPESRIVDVLLSLPALTSLELEHSGSGQNDFKLADLSPLLSNSPLERLYCLFRQFDLDPIIKALKKNRSLTIQISEYEDIHILERLIAEVANYNPLINIQTGSVDGSNTRIISQKLFGSAIKNWIIKLRTILLPKDRGTFKTLPREIFILICSYLAPAELSVHEIAGSISAASHREWLLDRSIEERIRRVWVCIKNTTVHME